MTEYVFEATLRVVVGVEARDEQQAREFMAARFSFAEANLAVEPAAYSGEHSSANSGTKSSASLKPRK